MDRSMDTTKLSERKRKRRSFQRAVVTVRWRSEAERRIYSSRLLGALRQVCRSSSSAVPRSHAVKEAADRILAAAARGRTRWSRTILLSGRRTVRVRALRRRPRLVPATASVQGAVAVDGAYSSSSRPLSLLERKTKILGSLIPGCRKLSLPNLLLESVDYIAALEMQVRAMSNLANMLSNAGVSGRVPSSPASGQLDPARRI